ncbi:hypothetical protein BJ742DRAFT_684161 [Cladochytrium replicatum]|nr:hypothetical protein BJ742DRAFT_684161 [Cladochytrium replicatum]
MSIAVKKAKAALRKAVRTQLASIPPNVVEAESRKVAALLFASEEFKNSKKVSVYLSTPGSEVQTDEIVEEVLARKPHVRCYIPRCNGETMDMVKVESLEDFRTLPVNKWNIREPPLDQPRTSAFSEDGLDLIIMPGLAFDREGWRIGHGKGYYDKFLERCELFAKENGIPPPRTVALALSAQIIETPVPRDEFDRKPDFVLIGRS